MFRKFHKTTVYLIFFDFIQFFIKCTGTDKEMYVDNDAGYNLPDRSTTSVELFFTYLLLLVFLSAD